MNCWFSQKTCSVGSFRRRGIGCVMNGVAIVLLGLITFAGAVSFFELVVEEWEGWKYTHKKNYQATDEKFRLKVYLENSHRIARHNNLYHKGHHSYRLKMNHFGDLLTHEFTGMMNGYRHLSKKKSKLVGATYIRPANVAIPRSVDWRNQGAVTPVKNQGSCGSCWSFSSTGALEGQHFRKSGQLVSLSEQNLIDCSNQYGNDGCNGGLMDYAFAYVKSNGGIDTEVSYPYEGKPMTCRYRNDTWGASNVGYVDVTPGDEAALKDALATIGPVAVAIDASQPSFQFYSEGIYDEPNCNPDNIDHGVLVVGYGTDKDGSDYWIIKNSWGTEWGEQGYIRIARNKNNTCGVASYPSYPLV